MVYATVGRIEIRTSRVYPRASPCHPTRPRAILVPTPAPSRHILAQLLALILLALIGTLPFWWTDLDNRVAALFYHPQALDPWWESGRWLWVLLYQAAPLMAGLILLAGLLTYAAAEIWPALRRLRPYAVLFTAATLLGPGLMINGVSKDFWGRPRPHQTVAFGGTQAYVPPLERVPQGDGRSFPCGHSSVGFLLGAFYMVWNRRRPRLARAALLASIVLGTLLGIGRMTAGDHFLSDVIWSAVLAYGIAFVLYYLVLRIPRREAWATARPAPPARPLRRPWWTAGAYAAVAVLLLLAVLLATPVQETRNLEFAPLAQGPAPRTLRLETDTAAVTLFPLGETPSAASIRLKGRGFGLPGSRVHGELDQGRDTLTYRVRHSGLFSEQDSTLTVGIKPSEWDRIEVRTDRGDIHVLPLRQPSLKMHLSTIGGSIRDDNGTPGTTP
jgi:lipid A 4'-phosphatase